MKKKTYNIEYLERIVHIDNKINKEMDQEGIPYQNFREWELGGRIMPDYVLRLIAYKIRMAKISGSI